MPYVDLHCHLLPGVDDGAPTMERTIIHAGRLEAAGVSDVACTPHIKRRDFPRVELIRLALLREEAQRHIDARGIDVVLHGGGELGHDEALLLAPDELKLIAQGPPDAPWLLLECPFEGIEDDFTEAAERLWDLGYDLLLAHPERAAPVAGADRRLHSLVDRGALLQVNATSLLGLPRNAGAGPSPNGCSATAWCGAWPPTVTPARVTTRWTAATRRSWPAA